MTSSTNGDGKGSGNRHQASGSNTLDTDDRDRSILRRDSASFRVPQARLGDSLRVPTTARVPAVSRVSAARSKVALAPGHSALDWHSLTSSRGIRGELLQGLSELLQDADFRSINHPASLRQLELGVPPFQIKPPLQIANLEVAKHNKNDDFWCMIDGRVYCITSYLPFHPGGIRVLKAVAGRDATREFQRYHSWVNGHKLLETCFIGVVHST